MRSIRDTAFVLLVLLAFLITASWAQSATQQPSAHEPAVQTKPSTSSQLMARSDLQLPKPLPVVKPLRFQEIPVTICRGEQQQGSADSGKVETDGKFKKPAESVCTVVPENTPTLGEH